MATYFIETEYALEHPSEPSGLRWMAIMDDDSYAGATRARCVAAQWTLSTTIGSHVHVLSSTIVEMEV